MDDFSLNFFRNLFHYHSEQTAFLQSFLAKAEEDRKATGGTSLHAPVLPMPAPVPYPKVTQVKIKQVINDTIDQTPFKFNPHNLSEFKRLVEENLLAKGLHEKQWKQRFTSALATRGGLPYQLFKDVIADTLDLYAKNEKQAIQKVVQLIMERVDPERFPEEYLLSEGMRRRYIMAWKRLQGLGVIREARLKAIFDKKRKPEEVEGDEEVVEAVAKEPPKKKSK